MAESDTHVNEIVSGAQSDAASEIVGALSARLVEQEQLANDPDYRNKRVERMKDLIAIDLALLQDAQAPEY